MGGWGAGVLPSLSSALLKGTADARSTINRAGTLLATKLHGGPSVPLPNSRDRGCSGGHGGRRRPPRATCGSGLEGSPLKAMGSCEADPELDSVPALEDVRVFPKNRLAVTAVFTAVK